MQVFISKVSGSNSSFLKTTNAFLLSRSNTTLDQGSTVTRAQLMARAVAAPAVPCNSAQPAPKTFQSSGTVSKTGSSFSVSSAIGAKNVKETTTNLPALSDNVNEALLFQELKSLSDVLGQMVEPSSEISSSESSSEGSSPVNKNTFRVKAPVESGLDITESSASESTNYAQIFATQYDGKHFSSLKNCPLLRKDKISGQNGQRKNGQRRTSALCFVESHQRAVQRDHLPLAQPRLDVVALTLNPTPTGTLQRTDSYQQDIETAFNGASHMIFKDIKRCMDASKNGNEHGVNSEADPNALTPTEISALYSRIIFSYSAIQLKDRSGNINNSFDIPKKTGPLISMRDEVFLQIMKQLQLNPSARSFLKGWKLLKLMCTHQANRMSVELLPFVKAFVLMACRDFQNHEPNDKFRAEVFSYAESSWRILSAL